MCLQAEPGGLTSSYTAEGDEDDDCPSPRKSSSGSVGRVQLPEPWGLTIDRPGFVQARYVPTVFKFSAPTILLSVFISLMFGIPRPIPLKVFPIL